MLEKTCQEVGGLRLGAKPLPSVSPCLAKVALHPSSSVTLSSRSTTRSLYFWRCVANSAFFKFSEVHQGCDVNCDFMTLCLTDYFSFGFTFYPKLANLFHFFLSFSTAGFAADIIIAS